jgi:hypothetical protein
MTILGWFPQPFFIETELQALRASYGSMDQPPVHLHQEGIINTYTQFLSALMKITQGVLGPLEDFRCFCGTISCSLPAHAC